MPTATIRGGGRNLRDGVASVARGGMGAEGAPGDLIGREAITTISFAATGAGSGDSRPQPVRDIATVSNGRVVIETTEPTKLLHALTTWAGEHSVELKGLTVTPRTLEDVYLKLTGEAEEKEGRDAQAAEE